MKQLYLIVNIIAIIVVSFWVYSKPGWESLGTLVGAIGVLIAQFIKNESNGSNVEMSQKGGKKSTNYQSAHDININSKNDK